jgi:hypothetical protein
VRILFVCKKSNSYGFKTYTRRSSGLWNSTRFIVEGLKKRGVHAEIVEVVDNNCIDREVKAFKPDAVVIEALWVVPEKFPILKKLYPKVKWFIHMHSGMPFLANEGIAMDWVPKYAAQGIGIIANSRDAYDGFRCILNKDQVTFLPNVYISHIAPTVHRDWSSKHIDVGCFGAIRPMKNHLIQALASIRFANETGRKLRFHINASRIESGGVPVMKNLLNLFAAHPEHELVQLPWMEPEEFINYLHCEIDIGLQVSMTETFNVVTADYVTAGCPIVISDEITWASRFNKVSDGSVEQIVEKMHWVLHKSWLIRWNQKLLQWHSCNAQEDWFEFVHRHLRHLKK